MKTDNIVPLTIRKIPAPTFLTFHCARGIADFSSIEGCTPSTFYNTHTYDLAVRLAPPITGIAGTVIAGPWVTEDDCSIQIKDVDEEIWQILLTFRTKKNQTYQFECYPPYPTNVGIFRIWFDSSGQIIESQGKIQVGQTPMNQQPTKAMCEAAGGHWYNGSCHLIRPLCYAIDNETDCNQYGCYWANGKCNPYPTDCEGWLTESDCVNQGCVWWDAANPYLPNTCHDPAMTAKRLSMDPGAPADIYSSTPPGSDYAEFDLGGYMKVYRGFGQVRIGGSYIADFGFYMDNDELWKNRIKVTSGSTRTFDEDFRVNDVYKRTGTVFRAGYYGPGHPHIPVEYVNMVLLFKPCTEVAYVCCIEYPTPVIPNTDVPITFRIGNLSGVDQECFWELRVNGELVDEETLYVPHVIMIQRTANTAPLPHTSTFTITYGHFYQPPEGGQAQKIVDGTTNEYVIEVR